MELPAFRYHPDPVRSGSVVASAVECAACGKARGWVCSCPVYAEEDLDERLCPWCVADGSAHRKFDATFTDESVVDEQVPPDAVREICERTPGYTAWQSGAWPACCGDGAAFVRSAGIAEIRAECHELEGDVLAHIVHEMGISGGAATRLLGSLDADRGPTVHVFRCLTCTRHLFHIDRP